MLDRIFKHFFRQERTAKLELGIKKIGLIASDGCRKGQVYEKYIERLCPDTKIIYPDKEMQNLVTKGICNIKNNHRFDDINSKERPNYIFRQVNNSSFPDKKFN